MFASRFLRVLFADNLKAVRRYEELPSLLYGLTLTSRDRSRYQVDQGRGSIQVWLA
jgi:hypothetical protein